MAVIEWIRANPALFVLLIWPTFTGGLSMVYKYADQRPRLHAFFSFCVANGVDIPKGLDAIRRALSGEQPPGPMAMKHVGSVRVCKDMRDPPAVTRGALLAAAFVLAGCAWIKNPKNQTDVANIPICVLEHVTEPPAQIVADCAGATLQVVEDLLAAQKRAEGQRHPGGCP